MRIERSQYAQVRPCHINHMQYSLLTSQELFFREDWECETFESGRWFDSTLFKEAKG